MHPTPPKTPRELRPRPGKTSPTPHQAWLRGRLASLGILAPHDAARYLSSCDTRAAVAFALGADDKLPGVRTAAEVEEMVRDVLGAEEVKP